MVKRIALVTDNADPLAPLGWIEGGGENVYINELSRALAKHGWTIDVYARWSFPNTSQVAKVSENVRVIRLAAGPVSFVSKEKLIPHMRAFVDSFLAWQREHKLEYLLIHGNYYLSSWACVQIGGVLGVPVVSTFHSLGVVRHLALNARDPSPRERIDMEQEVMDGVDRIVATSPVMKDEIDRHYKVSKKKIVVVPGGVNLKRFQPLPQNLARRILHLAQNRIILLYVGRIERRKGIDTLLSTLNELARLIPAKRKILRLYITGGQVRRRGRAVSNGVEKAERDRLMGIIQELGIADMVRFVGGVDREILPYYYAGADITVVPSYYEPFGLVPLESMACGTPVVASRVGGMQWTIREGKTGFLVKAKDPLAFAKKIRFLLEHPATRKHMRENGIDRVRRFFSWDSVAKQMSDFYKDLLIEYYVARTKNPISKTAEKRIL